MSRTPRRSRRTAALLFALAALLAGLRGAARAAAPAVPPALVLAGRVLDPAGRPAAGATVHLIAHRRFGPGTVETGRDGAFSFPVREGGIYRLSAEKGGYGGARRAEPVRVRGASPPPVEVRLHRPATLSGRVLGLTAQELARMDLTLDGGHVGADGKVRQAGGHYVVRDLPPGEWRIRVDAGGRTAALSVALAEGEKAVRDVVFPRLVTVRGRVFGANDAPLAGAQIDLPGPDYDQGMADSGADGRFVAHAPVESRAAWARAPGHAPASVPVTLTAGPLDGVELHLAPGVTLTGRLLGLRDADCERDLYASGVPPFFFPGHADAPGRYAIPGLGPGAWTVAAVCGEQSALRSVTIRPGEAAPVLDLDFGPGPLALSGRVLGEPGAQYEVSLERLFGPAPAVGRATVPSGGSFRFPGAPPRELQDLRPRAGPPHRQGLPPAAHAPGRGALRPRRLGLVRVDRRAGRRDPGRQRGDARRPRGGWSDSVTAPSLPGERAALSS